MRLKLFTIQLFLFGLTIWSYGQSNIQIRYSQVMNDTMQLQMARSGLSGPSSRDLSDTFGQNISYDFSGANLRDSFNIEGPLLDTTKFADQFPNADFAFELYETNSILFFKRCKDTLFILGEKKNVPIGATSYRVEYDKPVTFLTFPLKYKMNFGDTLLGTVYSGDSTYRRKGSIRTKILTEGSLATPIKNYQNILRANIRLNYTDTFISSSGDRGTVTADVNHNRFYSSEDTAFVAAINGGKITTVISGFAGTRTLAGSYFRYDSEIPDKIVVPKTRQKTLSIDTCEKYQLPSGERTVTKSGKYFDTLKRGCKGSIYFTINLTINSVDSSVEQTSQGLKAKADNADYQWLDCENDYKAVNGADSQRFMPSSGGKYAVAVTKNGCTDTSDCYNVSTIGFQIGKGKSSISIYPNPASSNITIAMRISGNQPENVPYKIASLRGKALISGSLKLNERDEINVDSLSSGVYVLKMQLSDHLITKRVMIK